MTISKDTTAAIIAATHGTAKAVQVWKSAGMACAQEFGTKEAMTAAKAAVMEVIFSALGGEKAAPPRKGGAVWKEGTDAAQAAWTQEQDARTAQKNIAGVVWSRLLAYAFPAERREPKGLRASVVEVLDALIARVQRASEPDLDPVLTIKYLVAAKSAAAGTLLLK